MTHIPPVVFPAPWRRYRHIPRYATRTCLYFIFPPGKLQIQTHTSGSVWINAPWAGLYGTLDAPHCERWRMTPQRHPGAAHGHTGASHGPSCSGATAAHPPRLHTGPDVRGHARGYLRMRTLSHYVDLYAPRGGHEYKFTLPHRGAELCVTFTTQKNRSNPLTNTGLNHFQPHGEGAICRFSSVSE